MPIARTRELQHLVPWSECLGMLRDLMKSDESLIASIGRIELIVPLELESDLRPLVGQRIAILRTDISGKEYLFRRLSEN
jgi:hypothetical protein